MDSRKRQLIFLWPYVEWGGAQVYCMAIMKLAREAWEIIVIMPRSSPADLVSLVESIGARIEYLESAMDLAPAPTLSRKIRRQRARISTEIESLRKLQGYRLDQSILHIDFAPWQSWILYVLLAFRKANTFVTLHNFLPQLPAWREFIFRSRMQILSRLPGFHIFASNKDTKSKLKPWVSPSFGDSIPVTYTCVDTLGVRAVEGENVQKQAIRERFAIPEDKFVVLTVGQFIDRKGRWVLLDAAKSATTIDKDIVFVWVTPTLPTREEAERVEAFKLGDTFQLVRSASIGPDRLDILRFFKVADCFVLPSFIEGLPIAILEAMALGIPTISTNVFAIPEAVKHEETGLLVEPGESDELCRSILRLKNDPLLSGRLAQTGKHYVLENFDERVASRIAVEAFEKCFEDK